MSIKVKSKYNIIYWLIWKQWYNIGLFSKDIIMNKNTLIALLVTVIIILLVYILVLKDQLNPVIINTNSGSIVEVNTGITDIENTGSITENSSWNTDTNNTGTVTDVTKDWKVYDNKNYWFTFKYPNNFFDIWHTPTTLDWVCETRDFPEKCPNINTIVTDLANYNNWDNKAEKIIINDTDYCLYHVQDAATWHVYNNYYYTTVKDNKCFVIALNTSTTNCDFYLPLEEWNTTQKTNYDNCISKNKNQPLILNQIITTFKFEK